MIGRLIDKRKTIPLKKIIVLGDTSDDLQLAIDNANSGDIIIIQNNIMYTSTKKTIILPSCKAITIQSNKNNNWTLFQTNADNRHFLTDGLLNCLTLRNITLDGGNIGGGIEFTGSCFIDEGTIIQNCYSCNGGGICIYSISYSELHINGSKIVNNCAKVGGGIFIQTHAALNINRSSISNNLAVFGGGGIYCLDYTPCKITEGIIKNNQTIKGNGGGINTSAPIEILTSCSILNNKAVEGSGGGIFLNTLFCPLNKLKLCKNTVFKGNSSSQANAPPENSYELCPNLKFSSTSISKHPLNNYDISYTKRDCKNCTELHIDKE